MRISLALTVLLMVVVALSQSPPAPQSVSSAPATTDAKVDPTLKVDPKSPPVGAEGAATVGAGPSALADVFVYDPTGKRDPFEPDIPKEAPTAKSTTESPTHQEEAVVEQAPKQNRPLEPLEAYDLAQLKVAAIIWNTKNPRAMVTDPQQGTHYIRLKSRIGRHNGFVAAIREGEIVVVEYGQENGQFMKYFKVLELR